MPRSVDRSAIAIATKDFPAYKQMGVPFPMLIRLEKGESIVFPWMVYKSKARRGRTNAKVMKDPRFARVVDPGKVRSTSREWRRAGVERWSNLTVEINQTGDRG